MAKINRGCCFYANDLGTHFRIPSSGAWKGMGWAIMSIWWIATPTGEFSLPFVSCGALDLRAIGWQAPTNLYVVEADNWRWPIWWLLLRLWRFACWFERNLRLTAAVWGMLKHDDPTCEWRWRDFVLLWWIRKEAKKWSIIINFSPMLIWLEILCLFGFFVLCAWWQQEFSENGEFEAWFMMWFIFLSCSLIGIIDSTEIKKHGRRWPPRRT